MAKTVPETNRPESVGVSPHKRKYFLVAGVMLAVITLAGAAIYYLNYYWPLQAALPAGPVAVHNPVAGGAAAQQAAGADKGGREEPAEAVLLPQTVREGQESISRRQAPDPFAGPVKLVGVLLGGGGEDLAIIEYRGATFVVAGGEEIDSFWTVESIKDNSVSLQAEGRMLNLKLDGEAGALLTGGIIGEMPDE